jgi:hypothetical protein
VIQSRCAPTARRRSRCLAGPRAHLDSRGRNRGYPRSLAAAATGPSVRTDQPPGWRLDGDIDMMPDAVCLDPAAAQLSLVRPAAVPGAETDVRADSRPQSFLGPFALGIYRLCAALWRARAPVLAAVAGAAVARHGAGFADQPMRLLHRYQFRDAGEARRGRGEDIGSRGMAPERPVRPG